MIRKIFNDRITFLTALVLFSAVFSANAKVPQDTVELSADAPALPVLVRAEANPFFRIRIVIPEGERQCLSSVRIQVDPATVAKIRLLDIYKTGTEPFHTANKITSCPVSESVLTIPLSICLEPGVHAVWVSVNLQGTVKPGSVVQMEPLQCQFAGGRWQQIRISGAHFRKYTGTVLRKAGEDSAHTYRIPGIVKTDKGTLIAVYDVRYKNDRDLPGDIDVGMSRSQDGGTTWEPMKRIMDMGSPQETNGIGDPAVLFDPVTRKIWVVALWSKGNRSIAGSLPGISPDSTGQFMAVSSSDDGRTWSLPVSLTPAVKDPAWHLFFQGPGTGIAMQDGTLVFAAQYWDEKKLPYATIIFSKDHGISWNGLRKGPRSNTTESQVVETKPGVLMLNMRDNRGGYRSVAVTKDLGLNWTEHASSYFSLPDPVCMASLIKCSLPVSGKMREYLFFSNPESRSGRFNMTIKASPDLGNSWPVNYKYLVDERACYGYSSLVMLDEKTIGLLYEGIRELYFVAIPVQEIIK